MLEVKIITAYPEMFPGTLGDTRSFLIREKAYEALGS